MATVGCTGRMSNASNEKKKRNNINTKMKKCGIGGVLPKLY